MRETRERHVGKTYFHVDMDAFFVSVEELFDPSLKGKPVVVGGRPNERGVVSAASYAARKFGVHSAMPLRTAYKLCPQAIFVDGHPERYRECSHKVYEVLRSFSPLVEMASIDEAYLDMTGTERLHGPPLRAAHLLHERMKAETRLNCSVGIAASRLVAKITSDQAKPNGILWVIPGREAAFLAPLDVRKVPGVGKVTEKNLHAFGIRKVGRPGAAGREVPRRALRQMGNGAGGQVARARRRRMVRHGDRRGRGAEIDQPRAHVRRGHGGRGAARIDAGAVVRNGRTAAAGARIVRGHDPAQAAQLGLRDDHAGALAGAARRSWTPNCTTRYASCSGRTGTGGKVGCSACMRRVGRRARSRWICSARRSTSAGVGQWRRPTRLRDKFGESAVGLASGLKGAFRERTHENPAGLPGKQKK